MNPTGSLKPTLRERLSGSDRLQLGGWISSGSPLIAEVMAGSGLDLLVIDMEHSAQVLPAVLTELQVLEAYPVTAVVRMASDDPVGIKQVLDLGAQNLIVPMVSTPEQAREVARATRYPPAGIRGVGGSLSRSARWDRVPDYLARAGDLVSLFVQIETVEAVANAAGIAATDGVDGVLVGPADLAASYGLLGGHATDVVVSAVNQVIAEVRSAGKLVGVNAFDPVAAAAYAAAGAHFVLLGADLLLLARASEQLVATMRRGGDGGGGSVGQY